MASFGVISWELQPFHGLSLLLRTLTTPRDCKEKRVLLYMWLFPLYLYQMRRNDSQKQVPAVKERASWMALLVERRQDRRL